MKPLFGSLEEVKSVFRFDQAAPMQRLELASDQIGIAPQFRAQLARAPAATIGRKKQDQELKLRNRFKILDDEPLQIVFQRFYFQNLPQ